VSHKPSVVGSASVYSAESGEERRYGADSSSVRVGLGPPARFPRFISHKPSNASSVYSCLSGEERVFGLPSNFGPLGQDRRRISVHTHNSGTLNTTVEEQRPTPWARPASGDVGGDTTRLSQVSSASAYSRVYDRSAIGITHGEDQ